MTGRRGSGEDSIYRDGDRWRGAVSLGYDEHGNRLRKKVSGRTRAEVTENSASSTGGGHWRYPR